MNDLMKQAQKMQEKMSKLQDQSQNVEVRGESGAGLVSVIMTGRHDIKVQIDDSILSEDKEFLEDLVAAAFNDAVRKVEAETKSMMSSLTGGIKMPPDSNFLLVWYSNICKSIF